MRDFANGFGKGIVVAAMLASALPTAALAGDGDRKDRRPDHHHHDHHGHHDHHRKKDDNVAAAAAVIAGSVAVAAIASKEDEERDHDDRDYGQDPRMAAELCRRATEARVAHLGRRVVVEILSSDETRRGFRIGGRVHVQKPRRDSLDRDDWRVGTFMCKTRHGEVRDVDIQGLRGW